MNNEELIKSKILTLTIGILDECEQTWGYLWGGGRPLFSKGDYVKWIGGKLDDECTDNESRFRDMWVDFRKYVLDSGNDTIDELTEAITGQFKTRFRRQGNE